MHMQVMLRGDDMAVMTGATPQTTVEIIDSDSEQLLCCYHYACYCVLCAAVQVGFSTPTHSVSERVGLIRVVVEVIGQTDAYFTANISTESITAEGSWTYHTHANSNNLVSNVSFVQPMRTISH